MLSNAIVPKRLPPIRQHLGYRPRTIGSLFHRVGWALGLFAAAAVGAGCQQLAAQDSPLPAGVVFERGVINHVMLRDADRQLVVYGGDPERIGALGKVELVLLPHGRRDVLRGVRELAASGAKLVAPARESYQLAEAERFWEGFGTARFHDYAQQTTKLSPRAFSIDRWVKEGDTIEFGGRPVRVLETPGYTRGSVTYLWEHGGWKLAFTGDLIYGDGQLLDLYSLQDAIPEAQIRGYHGYAARLADLVRSLEKLAAADPDVLIPARGPLITDPRNAIKKLIARVRAVYRNYLSTNALHWYFKEARMRACGQRVLGKDAEIELMPYSRHEQTPRWIFEQATSRVIISESGQGFLLDCGYQRVIDAVQDLMKRGLLKGIEGIFVTHYHDDHTDMVEAARQAFNCPVYAVEQYADVLRRPGAYHLPAMTANPVGELKVMRDGQKLKWHEYELTFHFFPGQTYYHGAMLARKAGEQPVFFIGDAFAPSGIDDYCLLNRNLLHPDTGYPLCFRKLRGIGEPFWLVNEHINHVFSFSSQELTYLETRYRERTRLLSELFPWDDPNYGIDEQWAFFYPYGVTAAADGRFEAEVRITNHSPRPRTFTVRPRLSKVGARDTGELTGGEFTLTLGPRKSGSVKVTGAIGQSGHSLLTAGVFSEGMEFHDWIEAMVAGPETVPPQRP